ncbi:uncharacterized protein [Dermacentor albipictus]|uniref:uncharacterized protein isoform X3 n=1 Tax=Dermacentor albipictus TaxID=60249 RepID=UPI0038FC2208
MQEPQNVKDDVKDDGMSMPSGIEHNEETMQPHTTSDSAGIPGTSEVNAASPSNASDILTTSKVTPQGPAGGSQDEATSAPLRDKEQVQAENNNSEQASMNKQEGKPSPNEMSSGQLPGLHDTQAVSQPQDSTAIKFSSPAEDGSNKSLPENAQRSTDDVQEVVETESQYTGPNQLGMLERSASDTEICSSSNAVKGMDLDAVFSKSLECVAAPVRQNSLDNDLSKRPHHHRGTMMRSRTLSVVSLLSTRGTAKFRLSRSQKLTLFCLCLVNFTSYISYSVIAPFYPQEATFKGMREAVSGFVFSVYALTMMVFSPIFGKLVPILGAKLIFFSGILCAGGANILFGLLDMVEDTLMFTVLSFLVRILEALGAAGFSTASYSIVLHVYPDRISTVFGIIETAVGVGMSIGPAIGGALYSVGGFGLPFYILGSCVLLTFPICWFIMRDIQGFCRANIGAPYATGTTNPNYDCRLDHNGRGTDLHGACTILGHPKQPLGHLGHSCNPWCLLCLCLCTHNGEHDSSCNFWWHGRGHWNICSRIWLVEFHVLLGRSYWAINWRCPVGLDWLSLGQHTCSSRIFADCLHSNPLLVLRIS